MIAAPRLLVSAALAAVIGAGGCGSDGPPEAGVGVSLELRHTEPLRAGAPVRWSLVLRNDTPNRLALAFPSGKDGDVVLRRDGEERYRWSTDRVFPAVVRELLVGPNETRTFPLEDEALDVEPGQYELVATLSVDKVVPPLERTVTVVG